MRALPKPEPIPTRPDEYWVVAAERNMELAYGGVCTHHTKGTRFDCLAPSVAATRRGTLTLCERHLLDGLMWIEGGTVVSWMLTK